MGGREGTVRNPIYKFYLTSLEDEMFGVIDTIDTLLEFVDRGGPDGDIVRRIAKTIEDFRSKGIVLTDGYRMWKRYP